MMRKVRKLDEIAAAFAEAVAEGDLREAEGWLSVAVHVADLEPLPRAWDEGWSEQPQRH